MMPPTVLSLWSLFEPLAVVLVLMGVIALYFLLIRIFETNGWTVDQIGRDPEDDLSWAEDFDDDR